MIIREGALYWRLGEKGYVVINKESDVQGIRLLRTHDKATVSELLLQMPPCFCHLSHLSQITSILLSATEWAPLKETFYLVVRGQSNI